MTKEIAEKLAKLGPRELVNIVSQWSMMPIKEHLIAASKFNLLARLGEVLNVVTPRSYGELIRFARDCDITATFRRGPGGNLISLERKSGKYQYQRIIGIFCVGTAEEFDSCARRILTDYLMQPEQALATPSGSVWQQHS